MLLQTNESWDFIHPWHVQYVKRTPLCRSKIFQDIERMIHPNDILDKVVYDLDLQR